ncbi:hypothetical protein [Acinetobacter sp.]|uniref:hypothetical protein n=1 Tax=Acinetobacter sp. TaxID=472 RepID=UPI003D085839
MDEQTIGRVIRTSFKTLTKRLEKRISILEAANDLNSQRRLLDAHICGQLFQHLIDKEIVTSDEMQRAIKLTGQSLKHAAENDWVINRLIDEHVIEWTERLGD